VTLIDTLARMIDALLTENIRREPFSLYEHMRRSSPLLEVPGGSMWLVFDYDGVKRVLSEDETFSSAVKPPIGPSPEWINFLDPPRHTKLRAVILKAFTPRSIANLEPRILEISRALLDRHLPRGEMDMVADYAALLPQMVIAEMIGLRTSDLPRFQRWTEGILALAYHLTSGGDTAQRVTDEAVAVKAEMRAYLDLEMGRRRRAPADDLLTRLVEAEVDGDRLSADETLGFFQLLVAAGTETTTHLVDNAILCLLDNPAELARVRAAPELLPRAIEEVLRYRSPAQVMIRETKRDVEMHGRTIPARTLVGAMIGSANRDHGQFPEPDRFDVGRDPNPHLALGYGIHFCLGAALTRLEGRIALSHLLALGGLRRATGEPWTPCKGILGHGPMSLPIRFESVRARVEPLRKRA
jgi:cytochrome P450